MNNSSQATSFSLIASCFLIVCAGFLISPSYVQAQNASAALEEIVVTARKREENLQEIPDTVVALGADLVERSNIVQVRDIAARIPNVSIEESLSPTSTFIGVRGIVSTRNGEPAVAMVVDGVQIGSSSEVSQALHDVEQIEVLKGPQGALYGRNAIGGAILITTKAPTDELSGRVKAGIGGHGLYEFQGALSGPLADNWHFRLSGSLKDFDGTIVNEFLKEKADAARVSGSLSSTEDESAYADFENNKDFRARLIWDPLEKTSVELDFSHSALESGAYWYAPVVRLEDSTIEFPIGNDVNSVAHRNISSLWLKIAHETGVGTLTSLTSLTETGERYGVPYEGRGSDSMGDVDFYNTTFVNRALPTLSNSDQTLLSGALQGVGSHNFYEIENISQEFRMTSNAGGKFRWVGGVYYLATDRRDTIRADLTIPGSLPLSARLPSGLPGVTDFATTSGLIFETSNTQDNTAWAAFFSGDIDLTERLTATLALRYDEDKREITRLDGPTVDTGGIGIGSSVFGAECTVGVAGCVPRGFVEQATFSASQPKISLAYQATDNIMIYGTASRGFRSGGFNASGATVADTYDQELLDNYELGVKSTLAEGRLRLNAAAFHMDFENSQVFVFDGQIFVQSLYNIPESEIDGVEVSFDWAATDSLTISGGVGALDSEITQFDSRVRDSLEDALNAVISNSVALPSATQAAFDANFTGRKLPKFPHKSANIGIQHDAEIAAFGGSRFITRLDYKAYSERYWWIDNTDEEGSEQLLDASVALELKNNWEASLWCKNCTDNDYISAYEPAEMVLFAGPAKDVKYAARGLTWGLQLQYRF